MIQATGMASIRPSSKRRPTVVVAVVEKRRNFRYSPVLPGIFPARIHRLSTLPSCVRIDVGSAEVVITGSADQDAPISRGRLRRDRSGANL